MLKPASVQAWTRSLVLPITCRGSETCSSLTVGRSGRARSRSGTSQGARLSTSSSATRTRTRSSTRTRTSSTCAAWRATASGTWRRSSTWSTRRSPRSSSRQSRTAACVLHRVWAFDLSYRPLLVLRTPEIPLRLVHARSDCVTDAFCLSRSSRTGAMTASSRRSTLPRHRDDGRAACRRRVDRCK